MNIIFSVCIFLSFLLMPNVSEAFEIHITLIQILHSGGNAGASFMSHEFVDLSVRCSKPATVSSISFEFTIKDPNGIQVFKHTGNSFTGPSIEGGATIERIPISQFFKQGTGGQNYTFTAKITAGTNSDIKSANFKIQQVGNLAQLILLTPSNGEQITAQPFYFKWQHIGAAEYRITISEQKTDHPNSVILQDIVTTNQFQYPYPLKPTDPKKWELQPGKEYWWKVDSLNSINGIVASSEWRKFKFEKLVYNGIIENTYVYFIYGNKLSVSDGSGYYLEVPINSKISTEVLLDIKDDYVKGNLCVEIKKDIIVLPDEVLTTMEKNLTLSPGLHSIDMGDFIAKDLTDYRHFCFTNYFPKVYWNGKPIFDPQRSAFTSERPGPKVTTKLIKHNYGLNKDKYSLTMNISNDVNNVLKNMLDVELLDVIETRESRKAHILLKNVGPAIRFRHKSADWDKISLLPDREEEIWVICTKEGAKYCCSYDISVGIPVNIDWDIYAFNTVGGLWCGLTLMQSRPSADLVKMAIDGGKAFIDAALSILKTKEAALEVSKKTIDMAKKLSAIKGGIGRIGAAIEIYNSIESEGLNFANGSKLIMEILALQAEILDLPTKDAIGVVKDCSPGVTFVAEWTSLALNAGKTKIKFCVEEKGGGKGGAR